MIFLKSRCPNIARRGILYRSFWTLDTIKGMWKKANFPWPRLLLELGNFFYNFLIKGFKSILFFISSWRSWSNVEFLILSTSCVRVHFATKENLKCIPICYILLNILDWIIPMLQLSLMYNKYGHLWMHIESYLLELQQIHR